jgi:SRSO17 transposase
MSLLDHPDAQALLADATLTPEAVEGCQDRLTAFLQRYLPRFYRVEHRAHASTVIHGLLSGLERKTCEPIASQAGLHRKTIQTFVGSGAWEDDAVIDGLRDHVRDELADPQAIAILDSSGFVKKGTASWGVARQWCGRLGKVDNCQVGIFLAYAAPRGCALVEGVIAPVPRISAEFG